MRPTLLNFRCPKERTPEFYDSAVTKEGTHLCFQSRTVSKRKATLPQTQRFPTQKLYQSGSGVSCFLGPGTYNDHDNFRQLSKIPCSSVMKKISAVSESESGKPCYIMIGNQITYEPSFVSNPQQIKDLKQLSAYDCKVSLAAGISRRAISTASSKFRNGLARGRMNMSVGELEYVQKNKTNYEGQQNKQEAIENQDFTVNIDENIDVTLQDRPKTCNNCSRDQKKTKAEVNQNSISTKNSTIKDVIKGLSTLTSQHRFQQNLMQHYENDPNYIGKSTITDGGLIENNNTTNTDQYLPDTDLHMLQQNENILEQRIIKARSMLPKTAINFYKMKKGLYFKGNQQTSNITMPLAAILDDTHFIKTINILSAYDEKLPNLNGMKMIQRRTKSRAAANNNNIHINRSNNNDHQQSLQFGNGYMSVIKDAPSTLYQKEFMEKERNKILQMSFNERGRSSSLVNQHKGINDFIIEKFNSKVN